MAARLVRTRAGRSVASEPMGWVDITVPLAAAAVLVALVQTWVAVAAKRDAQASAVAAEASSERSALHLREMVELMRPATWTAEPRPDQPGRSFQFRNTSGRSLSNAELHAAGAHVPLGTMGPGSASLVLDLVQLSVGYEVTISSAETGPVVVPLPVVSA